MSLPSRLLVFAACGCAGYFAAAAFAPESTDAESNPAATERASGSAARPPLTGRPEDSVLVAEWERLQRDHGGSQGDFGALYAAIKDTQDPFRRRAFRAALIAEWAMANPQAGLAYLLEKDASMAPQLAREWLRVDADAAISAMLSGGQKTRNVLRSLLSDVAESAPGRLAEIVSALPPAQNRWDTTTQDVFARLAEKDLTAARAAAESVTGPLRGQALAGFAKGWAEKAGPDAFAWVDSLPAGETRDNALKAALVGWAKTDPVGALGKVDKVPPGGEEYYFASDTGALVLREAANKDWDATLRWLSENPGKLGHSSYDGLQGALSSRLVKDAAATLRELEKWQMPGLNQVLGNAVLNQGYAARDAIWAWLDAQPRNAFTRGIRSSMMNAIAWKEPMIALEFFEKLPSEGEDAQLLQQGAQSLLNGGQQSYLIEDYLEKASAKVRPFLLEAGFQMASEQLAANPERWLQRLNELPENRRTNAVAGFARAWTSANPEAAKEWALALPSGPERQGAVSAVASAWASADPHEAAAWVNTLEKGTTRDGAAQSLVYALSQSQPETAWAWAVSIEAAPMKLSALQAAYQAMRRRDPAIAEQMLQSPDLKPQEVEALKGMREAPSGVYFGTSF